jgi:cyanophycinase-like exopeptidase
MNGLIALLGSGEYLPVMDEVDKFILAHCGAHRFARTPRVVCLPTAAGQESEASYGRWMRMGEEHFQRLGADVRSLPIIDRASADDPRFEPEIENADLIYFSGGNPNHLYQTMNNSRAWEAAQKAWARGAAYAGCSAGAMILARSMPDFRRVKFGPAFGIVPATYILPHFDAIPAIGTPFFNALVKRLKDGETLLGIDEETALIGTLDGHTPWRVHGRQTVSLFTRADKQVFKIGEEVTL